MILTYERFNLFKDRKITQDDIDLVSDLFLEISDDLKEVDFSDRYDMEDHVEKDSFTTNSIPGSKSTNGQIDIIIRLSFSDDGGHLSGISWLSSEIEEKQKIYSKKLNKFIERLKKYKFKVSTELPEMEPHLYKLHIYK